MKVWRCNECNSKGLTITLNGSKVFMTCDKCGDERYVNRS